MKLSLENGDSAEACYFDGNLLTMRAPRAFAPGSPIRFVAILDDGERTFEGRAIGSKRVDDARFEVRTRFINLRREERVLLTERLGN